MAYKTRVPVRGAIMLNPTMDKCLLVKGWKKGASWSFPRGKINKDEDDMVCAVREVLEETGFDCDGMARKDDFVEVVMREQNLRLYIIPGVPEDTAFECQTRKEISVSTLCGDMETCFDISLLINLGWNRISNGTNSRSSPPSPKRRASNINLKTMSEPASTTWWSHSSRIYVNGFQPRARNGYRISTSSNWQQRQT